MIRVARVRSGSIAEEIGIPPGTELLSVNGRVLDDFLDWEFLTAEESITVEARLPDGDTIVYEIEREDGEPLGVELEPPTVRRCANRCEFCFVEGLPKGLRRPLYIRDDDYRLSFAYGNFATLSNLKEKDFLRIEEYRLSPLYVSVHATDHGARQKLLNNPKVPDVMAQLRRLAASGIQFHCQMVIVPGLNDGEVLEGSLRDLYSLGESVLTTAVVPVGLTQFSHLYTGKRMDQPTALGLLEHVERWGETALSERGERWVFGSDELYLLSGRELPEPEHYGDFPQIENGIGAVTALRMRVAEALGELPRLDGKVIGVVTGTAMSSIMPPLLQRLAEATGARFELIVAENSLFGPTTSVAGLLAGADIRRMLHDRSDLSFALIPAESINESSLFLDDMTLDAVAASAPVPIYPSYDFADVLTALPDAGHAPGHSHASRTHAAQASA